MPDNGASPTLELAQATTNLEKALEDFKDALRTSDVPRAHGPVFQALRAWRSEQARAKRLPPYVIATDAVLKAIEEARPTDLGQLQAIKGIGATKAATYGSEILQVVATTST